MSPQYSELRPTNGWDLYLLASLGTPAYFNGFRVLASLLQRRRSTEVNQTARCLAVCCTSSLYYTLSGAFAPDWILPGAKFTLRPSLASSYVDSVTARHSSSGCQPNFAALRRGRHLYSAGRLSRWATAANILLKHDFNTWQWIEITVQNIGPIPGP